MMSSGEELEFHLRELRYDLHALITKVLALATLVTADGAQELCRPLPEICAGIEHDYTVHSPSALDLARLSISQLVDRATRTEAELALDADERWLHANGLMTEVRSADELVREVRPEMAELSAILYEAASCVARVEALLSRTAANPVQVGELLERVHASLGEAMRLGFSVMRTATWLNRVVDPERWLADQDEQERYEPLDTRAHEHANELSMCPSCGAAIEPVDRTDAGAYCMTCRTSWELPE